MKPGVDQRLRDLDLRPEALVEADLEQDLRAPAGVDHPAGGLDVERQRLLAEHVLAVGGGRHHGLLVEAVGRGHDDGVDVGRREDGLEAFVGPAPEIGRERLGAVAVAVEHRGEGGPLGRLHRRSVAEPHDRTGADQPDPDRRCLLGRHGGFNRRRGRTGCARTRVDRKNLSSLPPGSRSGPAPRTASPGRDADGPKATCAAPPRKAGHSRTVLSLPMAWAFGPGTGWRGSISHPERPARLATRIWPPMAKRPVSRDRRGGAWPNAHRPPRGGRAMGRG